MTPSRFDAFVVFAAMRTGSNFLESNLNAFDGLVCHGEAFNPSFIGYPNAADVLTVTFEERERAPLMLLDRIRAHRAEALGGFRYFHDHDPRVLPAILDDPRIAKIVLTRNPLDSYLSLKIAQATGQWKLTNVSKRLDARVTFDADEFETHLAALQDFQRHVQRALQASGQTAFHLSYDDIGSVDVINGLAGWLGVGQRIDAVPGALKRQNPEPTRAKVANPEAMAEAIARLDVFGIDTRATFEPRRGPVVPSYLAAVRTPLLYMPIRSGPETAVAQWLAALDGVDVADLTGDFRQASLRQWKDARPGHRSFTVIRHPVARAHDAFCSRILSTGPGSFAGIRRTLRRAHALPIPEAEPDDSYDAAAHRAAFSAFLAFVKANLDGQTSARVDAHWASQAACLQGMSELTLPDVIVREHEMAAELPALAARVGAAAPPVPVKAPNRAPFSLAEIYDDRIETAAREAYGRDYAMFGFDDWDRTG